MKKILTILLASVSALASAQHKVDLSRSIDDNGLNLTIRVNGTVDGKAIDYEKTFAVAGLSKEEKTEIKEKVFDSLGINVEPLVPPRAPRAPRYPAPPSSGPHSAGASVNRSSVIGSEEARTKGNSVTKEKAFSKEVKFNDQTGELFLRYQFMRGTEEFIYEKTVDASSKSAGQRESIIKKFEKEIELPLQ